MNLLIDVGNTRTKIYTTKQQKISNRITTENNIDSIKTVLQQYLTETQSAIISSVSKLGNEIKAIIRRENIKVIMLTHKTRIPIINKYETPATLGLDRLAAAVGAEILFPNTNKIIIDFGTAITIDFINYKGEFIGGNISPGLQTRAKSLNQLTDRLPLIKIEKKEQIIGRNTNDAILLGLLRGIEYEIQGYLNYFNKKYDNIKIIFTGGDMFFFDKKFKNTIFAEPNLVAIGLNGILKYNDENN